MTLLRPQQGCIICHESRAGAATVQPYLRSGGVVPVYSPSAALAVVQPAEYEWWPERVAR